ncbi:MAG: sulfotransferase [Phycisphaerales bacterium]|nr:sulfotransferase [Phycisphaerales bacterium]
MMQMLVAGGLPALTDGQRTPDADNPRGYLELERVKTLKSDSSWIASAGGHAIKVIHLLLRDLPTVHQYDVLFMERDIGEVLKSQATMLTRSGRAGAALPPERLAAVYQSQLASARQWLSDQPCFRVHPVRYAELVARPAETADSIRNFLRAGHALDSAAMIAAVDPTLYRNR